ncbi:E3 ubiquitin-protein ligase MGRN1 [Gossypium arboreum]|uniref:RING-type E3 ubiquitin transferase n=2 Tax=Gossypium TaxID=3633 RepID=A0A2P5W9K3_GOSBA|nr:hypothetical protein ES319_A11G355900v1 [Gossypium barbadense]KHG26408.1 E3 ubiquitin-protein ligase MGRN1 [Gossypium arboreum]PPR87741.1 hypothetical protein GOBAR_AA32955 [Gossypium barbadense]
MGNFSSTDVNERRRNAIRQIYTTQPQHPPHPSAQPQTGYNADPYAYAASTPYPAQYYQYPHGYYPPQNPVPMQYQAPYDHRGGSYMGNANWGGYPYGEMMHPVPEPVPYIEHQQAVTVKNDVNLKKETLKLAADASNPGKFSVNFTFDANVAGRMTVIFFAKEGEDCKLTPMKENIQPSVTVPFEQGTGQKFQQPPGSGISFFMFEESELLNVGEDGIYPLAVKAEAFPVNSNDGSRNTQITLAVFEKENEEYHVRAVKQILWVNGMRYELQEIYGIGNSVNNNNVGTSDAGKDCVICLTEPQDTTVLPCRHMCMCNSCAKVLRCQTNRCPICRQSIERLLEIKVNNSTNE